MEPLAAKLRPQTLEEYFGQEHLVGPGKPLRNAIEQKHLFSFLLWGPPGVGKTTLARIYANALGADFHELSAVSAGKEDIKKIVNEKSESRNRTSRILFLDEIHRFNKAQQDFLLPYVESGQLTLIGATTENPSFEVIPALLSRCRVFTLKELSNDEARTVIERAVDVLHNEHSYTPSLEEGQGEVKVKGDTRTTSTTPSSSPSRGGEPESSSPPNIGGARGGIIDDEAISWLTQMANGDARQAITMLDNTLKLYSKITVETLKETLQSKTLRYDKAGDEHYNTISAFIKSMRASQPDAALYYLARMVEAGEDPLFIARRMVVFASEDIGLAQPTALVVANSVFQACQSIGYPECAINLAHGVAYLAQCKKDRSAYDAFRAAQEDVRTHGNLAIPLHIRNAPTKLMKAEGYGKNYEMYSDKSYLPEQLKNKRYLASVKDSL